MTSAETYMLLSWGQCCISITDEVMSDLSDLFYWTHLVCYRQFCQTHVYYCRQVQPQCMRACARACARAACADDDDDEIILGIIALVVVKAE